MSLFQRSTLLLKPSKYKDSKLYSVLPVNGNGDFIVSRLGLKRYIGSDGLVKQASNNFPAIEYSPSGVYRGLLIERARTNYCFWSEDLTLLWTKGAGCSISATNITAPDGNNTADRVTGCTGAAVWTGANTLSQQVGDNALPLGGPLTFSVWLKSAGATTVQMRLRDQGTGAEASRTITLSSAWTRYELSRTNGTAAFSVNAGIYFALADGDFDFWGGQLEVAASASSYIPVGATPVTYIADDVRCTTLSGILNNANREGTIEMVMRRNLQQFQAEMFNLTQASASDTNRVFLRTTGADRIQAVVRTTGSRTNLILQSQTFGNAAWGNNNSSEVVNIALAPDGTVTADKFVPDNGSSLTVNSVITQNISKAAAPTTYTFSVYAKQDGYNRLCITQDNHDYTGGVLLVVSLIDGTIVTGPSASGVFSNPIASVEPIGNSWYRVSLTITTDSSTTHRVFISARDSSTTTGNGTSGILIWGAQLETGATATAYIPTTTVAVPAGFNETVIAQTPASHTNLILRSQEFDNASWTKTDTTVTANNAANPLNATVDADLLTEGTAGTAVVQSNAPTFPASVPITFSLYVKKSANLDWLRINLSGGADTARFWFNINSGTVGSTQNGGGAPVIHGSTIESLGNGWYRIICSVSLAGTAIQANLISASADISTTRVNNAAYWAWGAQFELGGTASRYVATNVAAVTDSPAVGTLRIAFRYKDNDCILMLNGQPQNTYTFVASALTTSPIEGSGYTHNGVRWRVVSVSGLNVRMRMISGNTEPSASGTLTKVGGIGDSSITFNSVSMDKPLVSIPSSLVEADIGGRTPSDNANFILDFLDYVPLAMSLEDMKSLDTQLATIIS